MIYWIYAFVTIVILSVAAIFAVCVFIGIVSVIRWLFTMRIPTFQVAKVLPVPEVDRIYWNRIGKVIEIQSDGQIELKFRRYSRAIFHPDTIVIYNNEFRSLEEAEETL